MISLKLIHRSFLIGVLIFSSGCEASNIPQNVRISSSDGTNEIQWDPVENVTHYIVFWNKTGNVDSLSSSVKLDAKITLMWHSKLKKGTVYYYRIMAVTEQNYSDLSKEVSVTVKE